MPDTALDFMEALGCSGLSERAQDLLTNQVGSWSILLELTQDRIQSLAEHDAAVTQEVEEFQFSHMIRRSGLSNRAKNVLLANMRTFFDLMQLGRDDIANFWSCGRLTIAEILGFQRSAGCRASSDCDLDAPIGPSKDMIINRELKDLAALLPDDRDSWIEAVLNSQLSVRTVNVLRNVDNFVTFFGMNEKHLRDLRNCGRKTLREILSFRKEMAHRFKLAPQIIAPVTEEMPSIDLTEVDNRYSLLGSIREILSERARRALHTLKVDTLEDFLSLAPASMLHGRNIGRKTLHELSVFQEVVWELTKSIPSGDITQFDITAFYFALEKAQSKLRNVELSVSSTQFNFDNPHNSLIRWVTDVCRHLSSSDRAKSAFLLRYGLLGEPPLTLDEIGVRLDITKERVRQIIAKVEREARHPIHALKLAPLINRIATIAEEYGGKMRKDTMILALLLTRSDAEMVPDAGPLVDFLSTLSPWNTAGLAPPNDDFVLSGQAKRVIERLSSVFVKLAQENADEFVEVGLWSLDLHNLKQALVDWYNRNRFREEIKTLSNGIIDELVGESSESVARRKGRLYSHELWTLRFGKITSFVETALKRSRVALHFTELCSEWERWRPHEPKIAEHTVHAAASRIDKTMLWGRGTFIHQESINIPHGLIGKIESWTLKRLKENIPFISAYGAFLAFEDKCKEASIPNETALYSVMRKLSHPLLQYPRLPYVLLNRPSNVRIPGPLAIEQYIMENGGTVGYDELCHYVTGKLFLKDFQFQQLIYQIPNVVRAGESGFIHVDCLSIDPETVKSIIAYAGSIAAREGHVSVTKVYEDRRLSCRTMGLDSPQGLYSLLQMYSDGSKGLTFPGYPVINHDSRDSVGSISESIIDFVKDKGAPCSYQEIFDHFVEDLGYNQNTVYYTCYHDDLCRYLSHCVIHKDLIEWGPRMQATLEAAAMSLYRKSLDLGRCFATVDELVESQGLPSLGKDLYWTTTLVADLLSKTGSFRVLGSARNAYVPQTNPFCIATFANLVYEILRSDFDGACNLEVFTDRLRELNIVKKSVTAAMLADSERVRIMGREIVTDECLKPCLEN